MTTIRDLIDSLAAHPGPVLTSYAEERVELGGPVAARWLAKISNLLAEELSSDLFTSGAVPARILLDLAPWQRTLWEISSWGMGWEVLRSSRATGPKLLPGDVLVAHEAGPTVDEALEAGAHALLQPREFFAFSWRGDPLPVGALDALAEVMAQPDALVVGVPDSAPPLEDAVREALEGAAAATEPRASRVGLIIDSRTTPGQVLDQWLAGRGVVLVDPTRHSPADAERLLDDEKADGGWVLYRR